MVNQSLSNQLKRIRGQIGGIEKMVAEGKDCEQILMQLSAAISSLKSVSKKILAEEAFACGSSSDSQTSYVKLLKKFI